jgi:hypothetical protein
MNPANLKWTEVDSSNIKAVAHDEESKTLFVKFAKGSVYSYQGADLTVFTGMIYADSVGKYLNDHVKPFYPYELISV